MKEIKNNKLEADALESVAGGAGELEKLDDQIKSLNNQIGRLCNQLQQKEQAYTSRECSISDLEELSKNLHSKVNLLKEKVIQRGKLIDAKID